MKLNFKICTNHKCEIDIYNETCVGDSGYLPESSTSVVKDRFRKSDTETIGLLVNNTSDGSVIEYNEHFDCNDLLTAAIKKDGWFEVTMVVLPTKEWFDKEVAKDKGSAVKLYDTVYYSDGSNIFKYKDGKIYPSDMKEVTEVNTLDTTIYKIKEDIVFICFLKRCYISLCQEIWQDRGFSQCWSRSKVSSESMFKRGTVWMTLNVIKYMVELNQLAEAQRLIENIGGCNGLCREQYDRTGQSPCGCS